MKITNKLKKLALLIVFLPLTSLHADSLVFQIGEFDSQNGDFEQESGAYNDPSYYLEPGDYTGVQGSYGFGTQYDGPDAEILQDGPGGLVDPLDPESGQVWALSLDGFPRAMVPDRSVLDIYFQLSAAEAAAPALLFETKLFGLGANSYHDVTFYLNNVPFYRKLRVTGDTDLKLAIPKNIPGMVVNEGGNVLSARRTGGGKVDDAGVDNPWIQFDALKLTALSTAPATELIWQIGNWNNNTSEFEQERDDFNNPQYHVEPGDYTAVPGQGARGVVFNEPGAELWGDDDVTLDGFPRALVPGRPAIDIYFKLTAAQAQRDYLLLKTVLFAQGPNSSHDVRAYLNGTPVSIGLGITRDTDVEVIIPRRGVRGAGMGPEFKTGDNVLSFVRTGGGPVVPVSEGGADNPYIQFDAVSLSTAEAPADPGDVEAYRTHFSAGYYNWNANEFEQESGAYNNPSFYFAAGDYSAVEGKAGFGAVWEGPGEIWQDGPDGPLDPLLPDGPRKWSETQDGFPRALIKAEWGRPVIDLFFLADSASLEGRALFTTKLFGLGPESSHDLEFFLNGNSFWKQTGITGDTFVTALIPPGFVTAGQNVISLTHTGGAQLVNGWIQFDQVEFITEAGVYVPPAAGFDIATVSRAANGAVTLTWESVEGAVYTVWSSDTMQGAWTALVTDMAAAAGATTSHTDSTLPANTTRRFYRVERTQ